MPVGCEQGKQEEASIPRSQGSSDKMKPPAAAYWGELWKNMSCCKTVNVNTELKTKKKRTPTSFNELY